MILDFYPVLSIPLFYVILFILAVNLTCPALTPNFRVLIDSEIFDDEGLMVQITTVFELPFRLFCRILVNLESLKFT